MRREATCVTRCRRLNSVVIAVVALTLGHAQPIAVADPVERLAVRQVKPLLTLAVERGEAHGILNGAGADYVQRRFEVTTPIEIDVQRLHSLPQRGCGRLEVTTRQRAVLENGARHDQTLSYQVSFCRDGRFPQKH